MARWRAHRPCGPRRVSTRVRSRNAESRAAAPAAMATPAAEGGAASGAASLGRSSRRSAEGCVTRRMPITVTAPPPSCGVARAGRAQAIGGGDSPPPLPGTAGLREGWQREERRASPQPSRSEAPRRRRAPRMVSMVESPRKMAKASAKVRKLKSAAARARTSLSNARMRFGSTAAAAHRRG